MSKMFTLKLEWQLKCFFRFYRPIQARIAQLVDVLAEIKPLVIQQMYKNTKRIVALQIKGCIKSVHFGL